MSKTSTPKNRARLVSNDLAERVFLVYEAGTAHTDVFLGLITKLESYINTFSHGFGNAKQLGRKVRVELFITSED